MVDIRPIPKDEYQKIAQELWDNLRLADKLEAVQLHKDTWAYAYDSMLDSDALYQARTRDGKLLCVFGTAEILEDTGHCVWCLGTKELTHYKRDMVFLGKIMIHEFLFRFGELKNFIGIENTRALTFITHMGAQLLEPVKMGDGLFVPFVIRRGD